jgi:hypothetical protein
VANPEVREPARRTLGKYGLSLDDWLAVLDRQGGVCAVCGQSPPSGRLVVDHEHVPGWKKMPAWKRRLHVRGIVCWFCNHYYLGKGITLGRARAVVRYLEEHDRRTAPAAVTHTPLTTEVF